MNILMTALLICVYVGLAYIFLWLLVEWFERWFK
jgi:hypothetical protein